MFFFFQAEDGIRDDLVTGVQTCALPICRRRSTRCASSSSRAAADARVSRHEQLLKVLPRRRARSRAVSIGPTAGVPRDARLADPAWRVIDGAHLARLLAVRGAEPPTKEGPHAGTGSPDGAVSWGPHALDR